MVGIWRSSLEKEVMSLLEKFDWLAVDVLRMGFWPNANDNPPTIIITVSENANGENWQGIARSIHERCLWWGMSLFSYL